MNRRQFISLASAVTVTAHASASEKLHIATNTYPWGTFAKRDGKSFPLHTDESLAAIASAGLHGYEPIISSASQFDGLGARLKANGLEMRSLYVNSTLHDETQAAQSITDILTIAQKAADLDCRIIVTNPSPIQWGGPENKTDDQLKVQATALYKLGAELKKLGVALAYHNHDMELRHGGRKFHHMLTATNPEHVKFCLDAHWIFRGCGDSQVALFDAIEHYGDRIVELHLRQSTGGAWSEVFTGQGDIDYERLTQWLLKHKMKPHLVLEQAIEKNSPHTLDAVTAHKQSLVNARQVFSR
jgi:inosose dehydratase